MNLIADSGSTKTIWYLEKAEICSTEGFNPVILSQEQILNGIHKQLLPLLPEDIQKKLVNVHFYGAGCAKNEANLKMVDILTQIFPHARIEVQSDMLAAARATCGHRAGIVAILGTGANACIYDGKNIIKNAVSLGYLIGDEGAGVDIGKALIKNYFYGLFPPDLAQLFGKKYPISEAELILNLYQKPSANKYLAQFAAFAIEMQHIPFVLEIIQQCFEQFIRYHLLANLNAAHKTIHFVGSIAYLLQDILAAQLKTHNLELGQVLKTPFPALLDYSPSTKM